MRSPAASAVGKQDMHKTTKNRVTLFGGQEIMMRAFRIPFCIVFVVIGSVWCGGSFAQQSIAADLARYEWTLSDARAANGERRAVYFRNDQRPMTLRFSAEGSLSESGGCNGYSQGSLFVDGRIKIDPAALAIRTLTGCAADGLAQDRAMDALFLHDPAYRILSWAPALLELESADGDRLLFSGSLTAESRYGGAGQVVHLEVAPGTFSCASDGADSRNRCFKVRELDVDNAGMKVVAAGKWKLVSIIEGFDPQIDPTFVVAYRYILHAQGRAGEYAYVLSGVRVDEGFADVWEWRRRRALSAEK